MKKTIRLTLLLLSLFPGLQSVVQAQGYTATAQINGQAVGDGTYNYTIQLQNNLSSTQPINTFWFAWVPDDYGYDLLATSPTITGMPDGWYAYVVNNNYYYPDGYSIDFYNYFGAAVDPGTSATFSFNSSDSPDTLLLTSPFYNVPTTTSYVYDATYEDPPGFELPVNFSPVPEPSTIALLSLSFIALWLAASNRKSLSKCLVRQA